MKENKLNPDSRKLGKCCQRTCEQLHTKGVCEISYCRQHIIINESNHSVNHMAGYSISNACRVTYILLKLIIQLLSSQQIVKVLDYYLST